MRYCTHCGSEVSEHAVICLKCGCALNNTPAKSSFSVTSTTETKTSLSIVFGVVGIISAWLFALVGHVSSIMGIVFGIKEYKETEKTTGLVLSIIGEVCSVVSSIIGVLIMWDYF